MFLPKPPLEEEKYSYCSPNGLPFSISGLLLLVAFSISSLYFIKKSWLLIPYAIFCLIYILNVGFSSIGALFSQYFDIEEHDNLRNQNADYLPTVDIYLPNYGEDIKILANTFKAVSQIDYPNYTVWCLDDAGRPEVKILAELHGFEYVARKGNELKKAGNMRNAFRFTTGEFILVFDADFAPRSDFLKETIFYMKEDKEIAILQTPQYFQETEDQTEIQLGSTALQHVFHRLVQSFRNVWGASICTGSCAIYRRAALAPHGGWAPVPRSEDLNSSLMVLRNGWKVRYIPLVLSAGLSPDTIKASFMQSIRWATGSILTTFTPLFWVQPKMSLLAKCSYFLSILFYLTSGLGTFMFSLPTLINVWFFPENFTITNYSLIAPALILCVGARAAWSNNRWGMHVAFTSFTAGYAHLTAIIDVLTGQEATWVPTGSTSKLKINNYERFKKYVQIIPTAIVSLYFTGVAFNFSNFDVAYWQELPAGAWLTLQIVLQQKLLKQMEIEENSCSS